MDVLSLSPTMPTRYWSKVERGAEDDCWLWGGQLDPAGYRRFNVAYHQGKNYIWLAHRVGYVLQNGPIGEGLYVLHQCDNRQCQNGGHLFLGTHSDNMNDMKSKGRARNKPRRGSAQPMSKLTEEQVKEIRRLAKSGMLYREIAPQFGICKEHVGNIVRRVTWGWLDDE